MNLSSVTKSLKVASFRTTDTGGGREKSLANSSGTGLAGTIKRIVIDSPLGQYLVSKKLADKQQRIDMKKQRKPYTSPILECYGPIKNFTTGGSGKSSEWSEMMGKWNQNMSKKKSTVKP